MSHIRFDAGETTLIIGGAVGAPPHVIHWGKRLGNSVAVTDLVRLGTRQGGPGGSDAPIAVSLAMEPGLGLLGPSGFSAHRAGQDWGSRFDIVSVIDVPNGATIHCSDARTKLGLTYRIAVDPHSGVLTIGSTLTNNGHRLPPRSSAHDRDHWVFGPLVGRISSRATIPFFRRLCAREPARADVA
jgi:alpha-galactosidase